MHQPFNVPAAESPPRRLRKSGVAIVAVIVAAAVAWAMGGF